MTINDLDLSVRALNCLKQAEITTVEEFSKLTIEEMRFYKFSNKTIIEIMEELTKLESTSKFDNDLH
jgi:DNA-directed RNA polymerase subunit alpha